MSIGLTEEQLNELEAGTLDESKLVDSAPPVDAPPGQQGYTDEELEAETGEYAGRDVSKTESFLQGGAQGASFGFSDEAAGVGSAVQQVMPEFLGGMPTEKDDARSFWERVSEAYKTGRDDERKNIEEAAAANPKTFMVGNIAGGIVATAPLMATGGAGASLTKAIPNLSRAAAPLVSKIPGMVKTARGVHKLAKASEGILGATKIGAAMGGVAGLGQTESMADPVQAAIDTVSGMALGGAMGGATTAAMKGVAAPFKWAKARGERAAKAAAEVVEYADDAVDDFTLAVKQADDIVERARKTAGTPRADVLDDIDLVPPKPQGRAEPSTFAKRAAEFRGDVKDPRTGRVHDTKRIAQDVDYWAKNGERIKAPNAPSLNTGGVNSLDDIVTAKLPQYKAGLRNMEEVSEGLIEKSGAKINREHLADIFQEEVERLRLEDWSEGQEATIDFLEGFLKGNPKKNLTGIMSVDKDGILRPLEGDAAEMSGLQLRRFLRRFREDAGRIYQPGKDLSLEERTAQVVAKKINGFLKDTMEAKGGTFRADYDEVMGLYAKRMRAWKQIQKDLSVGFNPETKALEATRPNWFKSKFEKPLQDWEFGQRGRETDAVVGAWDEFGKAVDFDFLTSTKDQLVFGRLFPEEALGLQGGSWEAATAQGGKAAANLLRPGRALGHAGAAAVQSKDAVKGAIFKRMLDDHTMTLTADLAEAGGTAIRGVGKAIKSGARKAEAVGEFASDVAAPFGTIGGVVSEAAEPVGRGVAVGSVLSKEQKRRALERARKRGGVAEAATDYMLQQYYPDHREERVNP